MTLSERLERLEREVTHQKWAVRAMQQGYTFDVDFKYVTRILSDKPTQTLATATPSLNVNAWDSVNMIQPSGRPVTLDVTNFACHVDRGMFEHSLRVGNKGNEWYVFVAHLITRTLRAYMRGDHMPFPRITDVYRVAGKDVLRYQLSTAQYSFMDGLRRAATRLTDADVARGKRNLVKNLGLVCEYAFGQTGIQEPDAHLRYTIVLVNAIEQITFALSLLQQKHRGILYALTLRDLGIDLLDTRTTADFQYEIVPGTLFTTPNLGFVVKFLDLTKLNFRYAIKTNTDDGKLYMQWTRDWPTNLGIALNNLWGQSAPWRVSLAGSKKRWQYVMERITRGTFDAGYDLSLLFRTMAYEKQDDLFKHFVVQAYFNQEMSLVAQDVGSKTLTYTNVPSSGEQFVETLAQTLGTVRERIKTAPRAIIQRTADVWKGIRDRLAKLVSRRPREEEEEGKQEGKVDVFQATVVGTPAYYDTKLALAYPPRYTKSRPLQYAVHLKKTLSMVGTVGVSLPMALSDANVARLVRLPRVELELVSSDVQRASLQRLQDIAFQNSLELNEVFVNLDSPCHPALQQLRMGPFKANETPDPHWITGGKQGQIYALRIDTKKVIRKQKVGDVEEEVVKAGAPGVAAALKRFPAITTDTMDELKCPIITESNVECGETANEMLLTVLASKLYDTDISPHFMQVYSAFTCTAPNGDVIPYMAMERIQTDLNGFVKFVFRVQQMLRQQGVAADKIPTFNDYVHNVLFQSVMALVQYNQYLQGMHNDLHPGNIFIKVCDETLYAGKPLKDYDYFSYTINDTQYKVPNLGFLVKLGDLGHATVQLSKKSKFGEKIKTSIGKYVPLGTLTSVAQELYSKLPWLSRIRPLERLTSGYRMRQYKKYNPNFDLNTLFNNLLSNPLFYAHPVVQAYDCLNRTNHMTRFGNLDKLTVFQPHQFNLFGLLDKPTFFLPIFQHDQVAPTEFIRQPIFIRFRVRKPPTTTTTVVSNMHMNPNDDEKEDDVETEEKDGDVEEGEEEEDENGTGEGEEEEDENGTGEGEEEEDENGTGEGEEEEDENDSGEGEEEEDDENDTGEGEEEEEEDENDTGEGEEDRAWTTVRPLRRQPRFVEE